MTAGTQISRKPMLNSFILRGAAARTPEFNVYGTTSSFRITVGENDMVQTIDVDTGEIKEISLPAYIQCESLGAPAEAHNRLGIQAGDALIITGSLEYSTWTDATTQDKRSGLKLRIDTLSQTATFGETITDAGGAFRLKNGKNVGFITGRVTADVEPRHATNGDLYLLVPVVINEVHKDRAGQDVQKAHFVDVTIWREAAENMLPLKKGDPVYFEGRLANESWTTDGVKKNAVKLHASAGETLLRSGPAAVTSGPAVEAEVEVEAEVVAAVKGGKAKTRK